MPKSDDARMSAVHVALAIIAAAVALFVIAVILFAV
jgi:hypothetical protein